MRALLWQYNKAERLEALIAQKQAFYNVELSAFWNDWIRDVFDLRTANAFGMQVWAAILGIKLSIAGGTPGPDQPTFGFGPGEGDENSNQNFGNGNFSQSGAGSVTLTLEQQRIILRLRYFQLVSRCTVPEINRFMSYVFADLGKVFVQDLNDMSAIVYVFDFTPDPGLAFILEQYDLLPRPATVGMSYIVISRPVFGFGPEGTGAENTNQNFENGNFISSTI